MPKWVPYLTLIAAVTAVSGLMPGRDAAAQDATDAEIAVAFDEADINGDDHVEIDEYTAYMVRLFANFDTDRDGFLIPTEVPQATSERFAVFDRDADGKLSLGEGVGGKTVEFFDADTNRDGAMTLDELLAFERTQTSS